jgi:hypothetical protein
VDSQAGGAAERTGFWGRGVIGLPSANKTAQGHITVAQEQRFRLATDAGQSFLLTLAHDAPVDGADLCRFRDERAHVVVEYTGEPGLASGLARSIHRSAGSRPC